MQNTKGKFAVVVHACDRYEMLFQGFGYFFSKYWDFGIDCQCLFATEALDVEIAGFQNIKSGKGAWSDRLKALLETQVKEDYVLLLQEDMWFSQPVDGCFLNMLADLATRNQWPMIKLHSAAVYKTLKTTRFLKQLNIAQIDNQRSDYLMSHQITLWKKDFLIAQLLKNEHPWRNEKRGTKRLKKLDPVIFHIDYFAENGVGPINANQCLAIRSEYWTISLNGCLNSHISRFITELLEGNQADQSYAKQLQHHYVNGLTHDGLPKPRKEDLVKRIKSWMRQRRA